MLRYQELKRRYELDGAQQTVEHLSKALASKQLKPEDFSLRDLAEALVPDGREWVRSLDPRGGASSVNATPSQPRTSSGKASFSTPKGPAGASGSRAARSS